MLTAMDPADDSLTPAPVPEPGDARAELASELARLRQRTADGGRRPVGMRVFATRLGLGPRSQSSVADFEHGRRIPVDDIIDRYTAMPQADPEHLRTLVEQARAEERGLLDPAGSPAPNDPVRAGWGPRQIIICAVAVGAVLIGGGWFLWSAPSDPAAAGDEPGTSTSAAAPPDSGGAAMPETVGGQTKTWSDPASAGGTVGEVIPAGRTVLVSCRLEGFAVENGNTWWYRIADQPWNDAFYATADAFYNNGQTTGDLIGTPYVDDVVPTC